MASQNIRGSMEWKFSSRPIFDMFNDESCSKPFSTSSQSGEKYTWVVVLQKEYEKPGTVHLFLGLVNRESSDQPVTVDYEFYIRDGSSHLEVQERTRCEFVKNSKKRCFSTKPCYFPEELLYNAELCCKMVHIPEEDLQTPEEIASELGAKFKNLWEAGGTDVTFIVAGQKFKAHKKVVTARSSVLEIMFAYYLDDTNEVRLDWDDPKAFKAMLKYMYTNEVENLDEVAQNLLPMAVKYDLVLLQDLCKKALAKIPVEETKPVEATSEENEQSVIDEVRELLLAMTKE